MALPLTSVARSVLRRCYGTVQASTATASAPWTSRIPPVLQDATAARAPRTNWTREEIQQIYDTPLSELTHAAVRDYNVYLWD